MTAQDLKNSILQLAVQGKLVSQRKTEASVDLSGLKQKKTNECEFDIPNSWRFAHLETITRGVPSKQYQILESEVKRDGRFPVISQSKAYSIGFTDSEEKLYRHEDPVVIFGDHTTEIKFVDFDFVVGADGVKIFKPITSVITAKFLFYVLQFYSRDLHKVGGYSRHYKFIKNNPIPLPPLAEQERIVAKIEELLPLVSEYDDVENRISALNTEFPDKLRKSILQQAVQGKLTERDPSDEPASELLKRIQTEKAKLITEGKIKKGKALLPIAEDDCPFEIPGTWKWVKFGEIADLCLGKMLDKAKNQGNLHPYLRNVNVRWGFFDFEDILKMRFKDDEEERYSVKYGDLVVCEGGEPGRCAVWTDVSQTFRIQKALHRVRFIGDVDSFYAYRVFEYYASNGYFAKRFTGETIKHLPGEVLKNIAFPLPPIAEQKRIVVRINELLAICDGLKHVR